MTAIHRRAVARGIAFLGAFTLALAACGSGSSVGSLMTDTTSGANAVQSALEAGGKITVWAWEPTLTQVVADFEAKYPQVQVDLVNAGTGNAQYTALQKAVAAGAGMPDVAQIEYYALPQFAIGDALADLTPFGAAYMDGVFTPGPWAAVKTGAGIYGLPMDSGPMALFYDQTVFDKLHLAVPTTWAEYLTAARAIHAADPHAYIANIGDAGFTTGLIWQAGGWPYSVDGKRVGINFTDAGSTKFAELWQQLIDEHLVAPIGSWSDEWYKGLGDGTIATLTIGAWMPANFESGVQPGAGKWRVAQMPQWEAGAHATSENGGSSLAVPQASKNQALAYAFADYADVEEGVQTRIDGGAFPATVADLESDAFANKEFAYFGGQKVNQVLAESARDVVGGWQYLPFQVYANSIFDVTVGTAYVSSTTLKDGLAGWQQASVTYGTDQGFTMAH